MSNSKKKLLMYMGGGFFSGHYNREGQFVDTRPVKVWASSPPKFVGHKTSVQLRLEGREVFDESVVEKSAANHVWPKATLYFIVEYDGTQPFITVPTINGPVKHEFGGTVPTREEFDKTAEGVRQAYIERSNYEHEQERQLWKLYVDVIGQTAQSMFTAHPKRTRRFASGIDSYTTEEVFEFATKAIGPHSYVAEIGEANKATYKNWVRKKCQQKLIEKGSEKKKVP